MNETRMKMNQLSKSRAQALDAVLKWETRIENVYRLSERTDNPQDSFGHRVSPEDVTHYLKTQRERLAEVLYQTLCFSPGQRVAEVGVAFGSCLLPLVKDFKYNGCGYDLEDNIPVYCRALQSERVVVSPFDFYSPIGRGQSQQYDFVICSEVVEHLFIDVATAIERLLPFVVPGGRVLLTTPNTYRLSNLLRIFRGYNACEPHPKEAIRTGNVVIDARIHPREYTLFEIANAFTASGSWRILKIWTWPPDRCKPVSMIERLRIALLRSVFRLPFGTFIFCIAERNGSR